MSEAPLPSTDELTGWEFDQEWMDRANPQYPDWVAIRMGGNSHKEVSGHVGLDVGRLIVAAPDLLAAAKTVLDGLNARIDAAPMRETPVFTGIAALHNAIAKAEGRS